MSANEEEILHDASIGHHRRKGTHLKTEACPKGSSRW